MKEKEMLEKEERKLFPKNPRRKIPLNSRNTSGDSREKQRDVKNTA